MHSASGSEPSRSRASSHCPNKASLDDSTVFPRGWWMSGSIRVYELVGGCWWMLVDVGGCWWMLVIVGGWWMVDGGGLNHEKKYCWSSVGRIWQWNSNHWSARIERKVACVTLHSHLQMSSVVDGVFGPQGSSLGVSIEDLWTAMILKLSSRIIHWLLPVWMSRTFENTGFFAQHSQSCKNVQEIDYSVQSDWFLQSKLEYDRSRATGKDWSKWSKCVNIPAWGSWGSVRSPCSSCASARPCLPPGTGPPLWPSTSCGKVVDTHAKPI